MTLEKVLVELGNASRPVRHTELAQLSGLSRGDVPGVMSSWVRIAADRRRELLDRMTDLAADNIELDFTAVLRASLRDADPGVRERAAKGLWDSDDRTIVRPLIQALTQDPSSQVRAAAATTLAKFAEMAADGRLIRRDGHRISEALIAVIDSDDEETETRRRAIEAVAPLNSERVRAIIDEAYGDDDIRMRQSAIYAMGRSSDPRWIPTVLRETRSGDPGVRYEAAVACGFLGDEGTVPHLISMFNDDDSQVQLAVVRSLGAIGGDLAKRALTQAMKRGDDAIEEAAEEALASIEFDDDPLGFRVEG